MAITQAGYAGKIATTAPREPQGALVRLDVSRGSLPTSRTGIGYRPVVSVPANVLCPAVIRRRADQTLGLAGRERA